MSTSPREVFRGWWIVAVAFAAQALAIGLSIIPYGLFIDPITEEFGASVMTANWGVAILFVVMTLVGPVVGWLVDHRSIRAVMVAGALLMSASFGLMSIATTLWQLGLLFGVGVGMGVAMLGPLSATAVVAKWFDRKRGRALGVAAIGPMAGGFLLTPLVGGLLESVDWRAVLQWFAVGVLGIVPLVWVVIRNRPEDLGQLPDGEVAPAPDAAPTSGGEIWTTVEILSARNFWGLALGVGIVFGLGTGWGANAPKYVLDLGYGTQQTAYLLAAGAGVGIPATVLFGWLAERFDGRVLLWISFGAQMASFAVLRLEPGFGLLVAAFVLIGFSAGAMLPVYASLIARMFGPVSFGQVMGLAGLVLLPFGTLAPPVIGLLRDTSGSYGSTLVLLIGSFAIGSAVLGLLRGHAPRVSATKASTAPHRIAGS